MKYWISNLAEYSSVCDGGRSRQQAERGENEGDCSGAGGRTVSCFVAKPWITWFQVVNSVEGPVAESGNKKSIDLQKFVGRRIVDVKTLGKELFLIFDQEMCLR